MDKKKTQKPKPAPKKDILKDAWEEEKRRRARFKNMFGGGK